MIICLETKLQSLLQAKPDLQCNYCKNLLTVILRKNAKVTNEVDVETICKALSFAKKYHAQQKRNSGEPFYSHPIAVASMITKYSFNTAAIAAAILHDVVEDTICTIEEIAFVFNQEIAEIVSRVTKLNDTVVFKLQPEEIIYKLMVNSGKAHAKDAILIKLLDRLHNLRTINVFPLAKQKAIATQTLNTYIPLAKYIGITSIEAALLDIITNIISR